VEETRLREESQIDRLWLANIIKTGQLLIFELPILSGAICPAKYQSSALYTQSLRIIVDGTVDAAVKY
jgi:hypothetical protein